MEIWNQTENIKLKEPVLWKNKTVKLHKHGKIEGVLREIKEWNK